MTDEEPPLLDSRLLAQWYRAADGQNPDGRKIRWLIEALHETRPRERGLEGFEDGMVVRS